MMREKAASSFMLVLYLVVIVMATKSVEAQFQWTSWSRPSECSRTCGQGFSSRIRECKPVDENSLGEGADDCRGPATIEEVCLKPACPTGSCNCGCTLTENSGRLQTKLTEATQFCRWTIQTKPGTKIAFSINRVRNIDWKNGGVYILAKDQHYKITEQDGVPLQHDFPVTIHSSGNVLNISLYYSQKVNKSVAVELDALYTSTKDEKVLVEDENLAATIGIAACGAIIVFAIIVAVCRRMRNKSSKTLSEKSSKEENNKPHEEVEEGSLVSGSNRSSGGKHTRPNVGKSSSFSTPAYSTGTLSTEERERLLATANNELYLQKEGSMLSGSGGGMASPYIPAGQGYMNWPVQHGQLVQPVQMVHHHHPQHPQHQQQHLQQSPIAIQQLPQPALNYMIQQTQLNHHNNHPHNRQIPVGYERSLVGSYDYATSGTEG